MNVFEDFIVDLKEQDLLEDTVIDFSGDKDRRASNRPNGDNDSGDEITSPFGDVSTGSAGAKRTEAGVFRPAPTTENVRGRVNEQIASFQMVEHVLTAVERHFLNIEPNSFDDLRFKKATHRLEQAFANPGSEEYFDAESVLLIEIEAWGRALAERDSKIPVAALRRYVETTQPPLSPQALFSLLRFYRGSVVSQQVLDKFDFTVTRLFSKLENAEKRGLLCPRSEIVQHIKKRYSDWSIGHHYATLDDDPDLMLFVLNFEDLIVEAEAAASLKELVAADFFERLRRTKQNTAEMFFAPVIAAASVECNLRTANRLVDLVTAERRNHTAEGLVTAYPVLVSDYLSSVVARTLDFGFLFDNTAPSDRRRTDGRAASPNADEVVRDARNRPHSKKKSSKSPRWKNSSSTILGLNRWLLLAAIIAIIASGGVYIWAEYLVEDTVPAVGVKSIDLADGALKEYVTTAKLSGEMLYAVVTPAFEQLGRDKQETFLKKLIQSGGQFGYNKATILNSKGKSIGYASSQRVDVFPSASP